MFVSLPPGGGCDIIDIREIDFKGYEGICKGMRMTFCPLFSGSSGNSIYIACGGVKLLVDAGMSAARIEANLREIGVDIREIDAILITHEHIDHILQTCGGLLIKEGNGVETCQCLGGVFDAFRGRFSGAELSENDEPRRLPQDLHRGGDLIEPRMTAVADCSAQCQTLPAHVGVQLQTAFNAEKMFLHKGAVGTVAEAPPPVEDLPLMGKKDHLNIHGGGKGIQKAADLPAEKDLKSYFVRHGKSFR